MTLPTFGIPRQTFARFVTERISVARVAPVRSHSAFAELSASGQRRGALDFGLFEISGHDMAVIATAMGAQLSAA
jgi:hypothetical protein